MSWLFSQALVAEFSADTSLVDELYVPSSGSPTQLAFLSHGKTTGFSRLSRFGMTCKPLTDDRGADLLTSYLAGFRARTSATQGSGQESKEAEADSGNRWLASFARLDRDSSSWKTSQRCLVEGWGSFSQTWPRWGLMLDGECWEVPTPKAIRPAKGYGLWPTLKASDGEQRTTNRAYFERRLSVAPDLPVIVALSTPPTPGGFYGRLNPDWCEWLTGFPDKWTEFTLLETRKIREWQQQHSPSFQDDKAAA